MPEPRAIDLPAALLLAVAALGLSIAAGGGFLLLAAVAVAGRNTVALDGAWAAAGAGCATIAALMWLTRGGLRPVTLAGAGILGAAWPLSGAPAAALVATLGIALAVQWGARPAAIPYAGIIAAGCAALALAALTAAARPEVLPGAATRASGAASERPPSSGPRAGAASREALPNAAADQAAGHVATGHNAARPARGGPAQDAARVVRTYYRALDRRAYATAWRSLSPSVRARFGGVSTWRAGFARTLSSTPGPLAVTAAAARATVTHTLVAEDQDACGVAVRRYRMRWELRRTRGQWRAVAVSGEPRGLAAC